MSSRTTERDVVRRVAPPIFRWHDQSCDCVSSTTGGAISNRRLEVLNMTIDHAATAFALVSVLVGHCPVIIIRVAYGILQNIKLSPI